jgi:hypothetical protein
MERTRLLKSGASISWLSTNERTEIYLRERE